MLTEPVVIPTEDCGLIGSHLTGVCAACDALYLACLDPLVMRTRPPLWVYADAYEGYRHAMGLQLYPPTTLGALAYSEAVRFWRTLASLTEVPEDGPSPLAR